MRWWALLILSQRSRSLANVKLCWDALLCVTSLNLKTWNTFQTGSSFVVPYNFSLLKYLRKKFLFFWVQGNELERGTNKSSEPQSGSQAICLFRALIHSPWTQIKRHSFLIFTMLLTCCLTKTLSKILREKFWIKNSCSINGHLTSFDVLITAHVICPTAELLVDCGSSRMLTRKFSHGSMKEIYAIVNIIKWIFTDRCTNVWWFCRSGALHVNDASVLQGRSCLHYHVWPYPEVNLLKRGKMEERSGRQMFPARRIGGTMSVTG